MLKKAGIIVAAAAAGLLALSPLAFAGDASSSINDNDNVNNLDQQRNEVGLVNLNDNEVNVPIQACNNNILSNIDVAASVLGILGGNAAAGGNDNTNSGTCFQGNQSGGNIFQNIGGGEGE